MTRLHHSPRPATAVSATAALALILLGLGAAAQTAAPTPPGQAAAAATDQPDFSARATTPSMTFEKAPGVLGVSIRSKRLEGLRAYATEPLGLTALGLEDVGLAPVNKNTKIEVNLGERLRFDDKGEKIPPAAQRLLDGIGRVLAENPETAIEIRVHTDDQGDASANQRLTQRRADAIRAYLIGRGVEKERLSGVGLGESAPIAGIKGRQSRADRAKNRRVELAIVPREMPQTETAADPSATDPDGTTAAEAESGTAPDATQPEADDNRPGASAPQGATQ